MSDNTDANTTPETSQANSELMLTGPIQSPPPPPPAADLAATDSGLPVVMHTRIGGAGGVRVQHFGGTEVQRVKAGAADGLEQATVRVHRDALAAVGAALAQEHTFEGLHARVMIALAPALEQL